MAKATKLKMEEQKKMISKKTAAKAPAKKAAPAPKKTAKATVVKKSADSTSKARLDEQRQKRKIH
jgi:hypothetical protein